MANFNFGLNSWEMKVYYSTINQNYLRTCWKVFRTVNPSVMHTQWIIFLRTVQIININCLHKQSIQRKRKAKKKHTHTLSPKHIFSIKVATMPVSINVNTKALANNNEMGYISSPKYIIPTTSIILIFLLSSYIEKLNAKRLPCQALQARAP